MLLSRVIEGCGGESANVVLFHGLMGSAQGTWIEKKTGSNWPVWLQEAHPDLSVWVLDYAAQPVTPGRSALPMQNRALSILNCLVNARLGQRPLILIGHSLGGIYIKEILQPRGVPAYKELVASVVGVVFAATPHDGASLASVLMSLPGTSPAISDLVADHPELARLKEWYIEWSTAGGIPTLSFFETKPYLGAIIVPQTSADPGVHGMERVPIERNHVDLVKPVDRNDQFYIAVEHFVVDRIPEATSEAPHQAVFDGGRDSLDPMTIPSVDRQTMFGEEFLQRVGVVGQTFILGDGGAGKSVMLGQLFDRSVSMVGQTLAGSVVVACGRIPLGTDLGTIDAVDIALGTAATDGRRVQKLTDIVRGLGSAPSPVTVFIDTLDLLLTDRSNVPIAGLIRQLRSEVCLFATSRKREFDELLRTQVHLSGPRSTYVVPHLTPVEVLSWAERYLSGAPDLHPFRREFLESLQNAIRSKTLKEVCSLPLRLSMVCELFSETTVIPDDLTITSLYERYWTERVALHRGAGGRVARLQQRAATDLALFLWNSSSESLALSAPSAWKEADEDRRFGTSSLLSEGVIVEHAGRAEFFHQTYAEFAVALLLVGQGTAEQLNVLSTRLGDAHSPFWPVARHVLQIDSSSDRYLELSAAVPADNAEGFAIRVAGTILRGDPVGLADLLATADEGDRPYSLLATLSSATGPTYRVAMDFVLDLARKASPSILPKIAGTAGRMISGGDGQNQADDLVAFVKIVNDRREIPLNQEWLRIGEPLLGFIAAEPTREALKAMRSFYSSTGTSARNIILNAHSRADMDDAEIIDLARVVLAEPLPGNVAVGVQRVIFQAFWRVRNRLETPWTDWRTMLENQLEERWETAQSCLASDLAVEDERIEEQLFGAIFSGPVSRHLRSYINACKVFAHAEPGRAIGRFVACEISRRDQLGAVCSIATDIKEVLSRDQLEGVVRRIYDASHFDLRAAWPAMVGLAGNFDEIQGWLLSRFVEILKPVRVRGLSAEWRPVVRTTIDVIFYAASMDFLSDRREDLFWVIQGCDDNEVQVARLWGLLASNRDEVAREALREAVLRGVKPTVAGSAVDGIAKGLAKAGRKIDAPDVTFLATLLLSPHPDSTRKVADLLCNESTTPDSALEGEIDNRRLLMDRFAALEIGDGTGDTSYFSLLELAARWHRLVPFDIDDVERLVEASLDEVAKWVTPLRKGGALAPADVPRATVAVRRFARLLGTIAGDTLPVTESSDLARQCVSGWDVSMVGANARDYLEAMFVGACRRDSSFADWLVENWGEFGSGHKSAAACALEVYERATGGGRALRLAQRTDCPPDLAGALFRRLSL